MSKKTLSILLSVIMLLSTFAQVGFASTEEITLGFGEVEITENTVRVPVTLTELPASLNKLASLTLDYSYDTNSIEYTGIESGLIYIDENFAEPGMISWYSASSNITSVTNEPLFVLVFRKRETAGATTEIKFTYGQITSNTAVYGLSASQLGMTEIVLKEPVQTVLTGITATPTELEVPYGTEDVLAFVENAITSVTALYSDGTSQAVEDYKVTVEENIATVTYEGFTFTISLVIEEAPATKAPDVDREKTKLYSKADVYGLVGYKRVFVKLAEGENGSWMPAHSDAGSAIYYSPERGGYDGLIKTSASDIEEILSEITWAESAPTDDETIVKYGDLNGDKNISASDYVQIKKYIQEKVDFDKKKLLIGDTSMDMNISASDYVQIKKFIQEKIAEFSSVADR